MWGLGRLIRKNKAKLPAELKKRKEKERKRKKEKKKERRKREKKKESIPHYELATKRAYEQVGEAVPHNTS